MKKRCVIKGLRILMVILMLGMISLGFTACSSDPEGSKETAGTGELVIGLTDAAGDFVQYIVEVQSITLTKINGVMVETLPISTLIDFAQYTEMTEFLTAATVPAGIYTKVTLTLNYENAKIWVENADGDAVQVGIIQDENGNPITVLDVSVQFENTDRLRIAPGIPAHLTLDFVLSASNSVEFNGNDTPILTVEPTLLADINPEIPKIHRVRGPLKDVDVANSSFTVIIRPFYHDLSGDDERFGTLRVATTVDTVFDINGLIYEGQDGIQAMDALPPFTAVIAIGDLLFHPFRFEAQEVYAGSSVPGGTLDVVIGNVMSRTGNKIIIKGATLIRDDGSVIFNDRVLVQLGNDTVVTKQLSTDAFGIDDISVGQRLMVFGTLTNEEESQLEMDATEGFARIFLTMLRGTVVETDPDSTEGQLIVDLKSIDARNISLFDFHGTGIDEPNDADPDHYQIETSTLDIDDLSANTPLKVKGFVRPFNQAPADFEAQTIINLTQEKAYMKVKWHPPTADAFESLSPEAMVLNMENASLFHHVGRGRVIIDLKDLEESPIIRPQEDGYGLFVIVWHGTIQWHFSFENFVSDLESRLADNYKVNKLLATGIFHDEPVILTAKFIQIKLQ